MKTKKEYLFHWSNGCSSSIKADCLTNALLGILDFAESFAAKYRTDGHYIVQTEIEVHECRMLSNLMGTTVTVCTCGSCGS
jgi:hypothetical protein